MAQRPSEAEEKKEAAWTKTQQKEQQGTRWKNKQKQSWLVIVVSSNLVMLQRKHHLQCD